MSQNPYGRPWRRLRDKHLKAHPECAYCAARGILEPARVVDHRIPWRSGATEAEQERLFNDPANFQSLCVTCHNALKQAQEKTGHLRGSDLQGQPLDPASHWWKA